MLLKWQTGARRGSGRFEQSSSWTSLIDEEERLLEGDIRVAEKREG